MSAQRIHNEKIRRVVMLWDRGELKDHNLTLVLQMAGCRVHAIKHFDEAVNLSRVSQEVGQPFSCLILRVEHMQEALLGARQHNQRGSIPLPVIVLTDHPEALSSPSVLQQISLEPLHVCSPVALLETLEAMPPGPALRGNRPTAASENHKKDER